MPGPGRGAGEHRDGRDGAGVESVVALLDLPEAGEFVGLEDRRDAGVDAGEALRPGVAVAGGERRGQALADLGPVVGVEVVRDLTEFQRSPEVGEERVLQRADRDVATVAQG